MAQKAASNRSYIATTADNGDILVLGTPGTDRMGSFFQVQFTPSIDFVGSFQVVGRLHGAAAQIAKVQFQPVPYRRISLAGVASDYALVSDPVVPTAIIQIPGNGLSVGVLVTCTAGTCSMVSLDMQGPAAN